VEAVARYSCE